MCLKHHPGDNFCSWNKHSRDCEYFARCLCVVCLCDRFCQCDGATTVQDAAIELALCVASIEMNDKIEDGYGPTHEC